jgi:hypothetical protein
MTERFTSSAAAAMSRIYFAIRIGSRPKNFPYFMLGEGTGIPRIFNSKSEAEKKCEGRINFTPVRIEIREIRKSADKK